MLERNRTFGRVSRPVDKASAPRQVLERQRKAGRAKRAAVIQPKPQATRFRDPARDAAKLASASILAREEPVPSVIAADPVPVAAPAVPAEAPVSDATFIAMVAVVEAAAPIDTAKDSSSEMAEASSDAPELAIDPVEKAALLAAPALSVAMDPSARPTPPAPRRTSKRRPVLRLAVAISAALACLLAFARFSDAHLSAPPIFSQATPAAISGDTAPVGVALPRVAALTLFPADAATLPPLLATAAYGTDDLIETAALPPSSAERVTARAAAIPEKAESHAAPPRKPAAKPAAARTAAPSARGEASRQEVSRGPILDFLSDLIH